MKVYFINPIGYSTPMLFETFVDTFIKEGHEIVNDVEDASVVFIDLHSRIGFYNSIILEKALGKKIVVFDFWDYGGCEDGTHIFPYTNHFQLEEFLEQSVGYNIWFVRKLDRKVADIHNVYPIELIKYPDHDFAAASKEELFNRPNDIFFVGNTSPARENVCRVLDKYFKCDFVLGQPRLSHEDWLNRAKKAKFFLSADGGGFSDERPYQLITISAFLKQRNNQVVFNDFLDSLHCVTVAEQPTKHDLSNLMSFLYDKESLYEIYLNGINHMKIYFNAEYRAEYILKILEEKGVQ